MTDETFKLYQVVEHGGGNCEIQEFDTKKVVAFGDYDDLYGIVRALNTRPEPEAREAVAVWRNVRGFEDSYEVSCFGDIRNKRTGKVLSKSLAGAGYVKADLHVNGSVKQTYVHRVVADAFLGPIPDGYEINHLNGVKTDNRVDNLEITNRSRNETHKNRVLGQKGKMIFATRISDGKVFRFFSIMECEEILGLTTDKVRQCLTGYRNSHKGWTFEEAPTTPPDDEARRLLAELYGYMHEAIPALEATGVNVSLTADLKAAADRATAYLAQTDAEGE